MDAAGDEPLAAALDRFGETPVVIRTASDKTKLWYGHDGEGRHIRVPSDLPIDELGAGFTIAPPSYRSDLGAAYRFLKSGLADLDRLPKIDSGALGAPVVYAGRSGCDVRVGERKRVLWRYCMVEARHCDDPDALLDCAETFAAQMPDPLGVAEIKRAVQSAWSYEAAERNFVGMRRPQVTSEDRVMDTVSGLDSEPELRVHVQRTFISPMASPPTSRAS